MDESQAGLREQSASQLSVIILRSPHGLGRSLSHPAEPLFIRFPFENVFTLLPFILGCRPR